MSLGQEGGLLDLRTVSTVAHTREERSLASVREVRVWNDYIVTIFVIYFTILCVRILRFCQPISSMANRVPTSGMTLTFTSGALIGGRGGGL
jgi:hypothetical protein